MTTTYRALVCPGTGPLSGQWYACVRWEVGSGNRGVRVLGQHGVGTWQHAASHAVKCARALNMIEDELNTTANAIAR